MAVATAAQVAATVVKGVGAAQAAGAQAKVARMNSQQASEDARQSILDTEQQIRIQQQQAAQKRGQARAAMAGGGIDVAYGSAADVLADQAEFAQEDSLELAKQGARQTMSYRISASNYSMQASAAKAQQQGAILGTIFGAATTALGGASQMSQLSKMNSLYNGGTKVTSAQAGKLYDVSGM